jgi:hypothetical protein
VSTVDCDIAGGGLLELVGQIGDGAGECVYLLTDHAGAAIQVVLD